MFVFLKRYADMTHTQKERERERERERRKKKRGDKEVAEKREERISDHFCVSLYIYCTDIKKKWSDILFLSLSLISFS